ncbi:MAG TPA: SRPBCC family protein [Tepidisphaeraceae bacterium]|nr:SRPBCC family protein [Tepidisphaeraceae bacterium]
MNVAQTERVVSTVVGGAIALAGLKMRSLPGLLLAAVGGGLVYRGVTGHCHMYDALGVNTAEDEHAGARPEDYFERGIHVEESMTVERSPWDLYSFWRNFENLAQFMKHVESVKVLDDKRSHWVVRAPAGTTVEWDAEIINEEPNSLIAWRSLGNANVDNAGSVRFVPGPEGRGTEVRVVIDYIPPAGRLGKWVAALFGKNPESQIREDLRRFKRLMETGEVPTVEGQPTGTCGR